MITPKDIIDNLINEENEETKILNEKLEPCEELKPCEDLEQCVILSVKHKPLKHKQVKKMLNKYLVEDQRVFEVGVDEVGRGPMFGRVYTAAVILPKDDTFDFSIPKDSKKFTSKKKILEASNYIKEHALAWEVSYEDEQKIDEINILQATQVSMHKSILKVIDKFKKTSVFKSVENPEIHLLIDGNYFNPIIVLNKNTNKLESIPHIMIKGGDNKYASIAAASILAKVERDKYIEELCIEDPTLDERYDISSNKGYGTKPHMDGINKFGITKWHRKTFGICKSFN